MKKTIIAIIVLLTLLILFPGTIPAEEIKGQKPMMIIGETFQFIPGTWAEYYINDKIKKEYYHMYLAINEKDKRDGKPCSWMEIEVKTEKDPTVVTRLLVEETRQGPGEIMDVIVQVKGYSPFIVPESFYKEDKEVGNFQTSHVANRVERRLINYKNKELNVWKVQTKDTKGKIMDAIISEEVPPIGIVMIENPEIGMYLDGWGMNARSKIEGTPVNFYLWLMYQIFEGLSKEDKK